MKTPGAALLEVADPRFVRRVIAATWAMFVLIELSVLGSGAAMLAIFALEVSRNLANYIANEKIAHWFSSRKTCVEVVSTTNLAVNLAIAHVAGWTLPVLLYVPFHVVVVESMRHGARTNNVLALVAAGALAVADGAASPALYVVAFSAVIWFLAEGRGAIMKDTLARAGDARAEVERSREQYRALVENTHAVPCQWDIASSAFTFVAPQAASVLGCPATAWLSPAFVDERVHPEDRDETSRALAALSTTETEFRLKRDNGAISWVRFAYARPSPFETAVRGVLIDVTERRALEVDLRNNQKLTAIGALAAGVAHELNTPMQFVADNAEFLATNILPLLDDAPVADAQRAFLQSEIPAALSDMKAGVQRVTSILAALKEFSHPSNGVRAPVKLKEVVESTVTVARNEWKYVADVDVHVPASLPEIPVLRDELNQVLLNLIVNASHAIGDRRDAKEKGHIVIDGTVEGTHAVLRVADDGCGMTEVVRQRIFDPFFTTKPVGKGTGQGLAIAWSIVVDKHQGSISVDSEPGIGSIFTIRLPLDVAQTGA